MLKTLLRKTFMKKHKAHECVCGDSKTLCQVLNGQQVRIEHLKGEEGLCQRLREMGFCEESVVKKIADSGTLICKVCDAKVVLSKNLAEKIIVKSICPCKGHHDGK
jgi:ferrous iron transport protein A